MEFVVAAAAVAAAAVGIALWIRYITRRQRLWTGRLAEAIPVHSKFWRERKAERGQLLYVALGDSAAQGIGASRPAHSYVGVVAARVRTQTERMLRVANLGIAGATLRIAIDQQLPQLARLQPDILTVSIGANDIRQFDPTQFERDVRELFAALPSHTIVADLPSFYFLPAEKKVTVANRILHEVAAEHGFRVAPLYRRTRRQGLWGMSTQFAGDLFHPNDRGYRVWASAFGEAVDDRMRELG